MKLRRAGALGAVALGSALAALALTRLWIPGKLFQQVEETTLDWRSQARPSRPPGESPVVLVMFDSASVAEWPYLAPFPRGVLAELVEVVRRSGARAIGVDVLLDRRYPALDSLDGGEARLRGALRRAGNVVLVSITEDAGAGRVHLPPDPFFASVAAGVGVADLPTPYEPVRDGALAVDAGGRLHPGFATTLYALATGGSADSLLARAAAEGRFRFPGLAERWSRLPRRGTAAAVPLLFRGPPSRPGHNDRAFLAFSAADLLALGDAVPPEWFAGKVVLLGSGFHAEDRFRTPHYADNPDAGERGKLAGWTYGVELHATLLENLLTGSFPRALPGWAVGALLLGVALAAAAATFGAGIAWGATAALGLALLNAGVAFWAFGAHALVLPVAAPALAAALAFAGATSWVSIVEGREKRVIRAAFSRYLAPALVDELVDDPSRLRLGGEKRSVSILFCDLEGFTALAETRDPH
ncbi:MAG TPA: CHASE2 domain-containing protein, partial [Longimicrobiaceae bacterium]|nr:CHASE2 domain-containing protein [Longimicrobiaceae bacterium]